MERFAGFTPSQIFRLAAEELSEQELAALVRQGEVVDWPSWRDIVSDLDPESEVAEDVFEEVTTSLIRRRLAREVKKSLAIKGSSLGISRRQQGKSVVISLLAFLPKGKEISVEFTLSAQGVEISVKLNGQVVSRLIGAQDDAQWNIEESRTSEDNEQRICHYVNRASQLEGRGKQGFLRRQAYGVMGEHAQNPKSFPGSYPVEEPVDEALYGLDPENPDHVDRPMDEEVDLEEVVRKMSLTDLNLPVGD